MKLSNIIPTLFFFTVGLAASYAFAVVLSLVVYSSLRCEDVADTEAF